MASETPNAQAKIKLYWLEKSRSQRILWLLEELKVPYEIETFKRGKDMLAPPELKQVHALGKSPVVTIEAPRMEKLVLAESAFITEYLIEHFGAWLQPKRYPGGKEGQVGGETQEWLRYRYFMHFAEGSFMIYQIVALIVSTIKNAPVPFFFKPITGRIAGRVESSFLKPNFKNIFEFLEGQIASSPGNGEYLCGKEITAADILMCFPLEASRSRAGMVPETYPKVCAYLEKLKERDAYKRAIQKIVDVEGSYTSPF